MGSRNINKYGAIDGMSIGKGNGSTLRKSVPGSFCPSQISGRFLVYLTMLYQVYYSVEWEDDWKC
jgi:hypothetical protein